MSVIGTSPIAVKLSSLMILAKALPFNKAFAIIMYLNENGLIYPLGSDANNLLMLCSFKYILLPPFVFNAFTGKPATVLDIRLTAAHAAVKPNVVRSVALTALSSPLKISNSHLAGLANPLASLFSIGLFLSNIVKPPIFM